MKTNSLIFYLLNCCLLFAQPPNIDWQKTIGGSLSDDLSCVVKTIEGNYIIAGSSNSFVSGDKTQIIANYDDFWVLKINNSNGGILWQNSFKNASSAVSSYNPTFVSLNKDDTTGFLIGGTTGNIDSWNMNLYHINNNGLFIDNAVTDLTPYCSISCNGCPFGTNLSNLYKTNDNNYLSGGTTHAAFSACDPTWVYSIRKTNTLTSGTDVFKKYFGGSGNDQLNTFIATLDGGNILCGTSDSNISGDKTENSIGGTDFWIIKIDGLGNIVWQNTIGGALIDKANTIQQTADGGFIVGGSSISNISGDKTENCKGGFDYWVVKIDTNGLIEWEKTIGGSLDDKLTKIKQTIDGGYIICGNSKSSISGDKTQNSYGNNDGWIVKINSSGTVIWDKTIGGSLEDIANDIFQTVDNGYLLACTSNSSISGNKSENSKGGNDYWLLKLFAENLSTNDFNFGEVQLYPNPTNSIVNLSFKDKENQLKIRLENTLGQLVYSNVFYQTSFISLPVNNQSGIYFLTIEKENQSYKTFKIVKN